MRSHGQLYYAGFGDTFVSTHYEDPADYFGIRVASDEDEEEYEEYMNE